MADMDLSQLQALLPASVRDMAQRIGLPATLVVVNRLGGIPWLIAEGRGSRGRARRAALAKLVGNDIEEQLHTHYRGEEIYLPRCHLALLQVRNNEIILHFEQGLRDGRSARSLLVELARKYELSSRWVWEIVNQPSSDHSLAIQPTLFH